MLQNSGQSSTKSVKPPHEISCGAAQSLTLV